MSLFKAYALTFEPQLFERVWGGRSLERFGKRVPPGEPIGESWEISDVEGAPSRITRGAYAGSTMRDLMESHAAPLVGEHGPCKQFPLLLKILDARDDLSIQVHPSDDDLRRAGSSMAGKTEAWVILEAEPGAKIIHGLAPGATRTRLYRRLAELGGGPFEACEAESFFRWVSVVPGDVVYIPAGTIHALGSGILLLEIQETSDVTYRIHDWGRMGTDGKPRRLHVEAAWGIAEPEVVPCPVARIGANRGPGGPAGFTCLMECSHFRVEHAFLGPDIRASTLEEGPGFHILAGHGGCVLYRGPDGDRLEIRPGDSVLLPAALGRYELAAAHGCAGILRFRAGA